jgi:hypothetical protein
VKTKLIIVPVLLFFSLLAMLHFSLPVKGIEEPTEDERMHESLPHPNQTPGSDQNLAPDPNATGQLPDIFATNNTKGH